MATHPQAVITGAASGIGAAFARLAAAQAHDLLLADRDADGLAALSRELREKGVAVNTLTVDLADRAGIESLAAAITALPRVELLVNSAGLSQEVDFLKVPPPALWDMVTIHCQAVMVLSRAAAFKMVAQRQGAIINVASLIAILDFQAATNYAASKAYVVKFSQCLNIELRAAGVYVQAFCPGYTRTNLHTDRELNTIPNLFFSKPDDVVRASWDAMKRRRTICIPGWRHRLLWLLVRLHLVKLTWLVLLKIEHMRGIKVKLAPQP